MTIGLRVSNWRTGVRQIAKYTVVAVCEHQVDALQCLHLCFPDALIMDALPAALDPRALAGARRRCRVLLSAEWPKAARATERAGAHGFLLKPAGHRSLENALECLFSGQGHARANIGSAFDGADAPHTAAEMAGVNPLSILTQSSPTRRLEEALLAVSRAARFRAGLLAELCRLSARQLERLFAKRFDTTPRAWLEEQRRTDDARLVEHGADVKTRAAQLGYAHPSSYCAARRNARR